MDDDNFISNSPQIRNKFNNMLSSIGQETYSTSTIHKCFGGLAEHNLITKMKVRGLFQVSPLFFYKGSEEAREKLIRNNLEEINKIPINKYRKEQIMKKVYSSSQRFPDDSES